MLANPSEQTSRHLIKILDKKNKRGLQIIFLQYSIVRQNGPGLIVKCPLSPIFDFVSSIALSYKLLSVYPILAAKCVALTRAMSES